MVSDNNALRAVHKDKTEMVNFKDEKIVPEKMYDLVCAEDYIYPLGGKVEFKANKPVKVSGLFAKNIVKMTKGKVQFADKELWTDSSADRSRDQEIDELKETVKTLTALALKKEEEIVKVAVPKTSVKNPKSAKK